MHIVNVDKVQELGEQMLNQVLVTKQTGPGGKPVNTLYLAAKMQLTNEMYFAILLDRSTAGPMMIGCSKGGTSIEDLAEKYPEKIIKIPVDIREGITDAQANEMVEGLQVTTDKKAAAEQIKNMYEMFTSCDCTMVEVGRLTHTLHVFHVHVHSRMMPESDRHDCILQFMRTPSVFHRQWRQSSQLSHGCQQIPVFAACAVFPCTKFDSQLCYRHCVRRLTLTS